MAAQVPFLEGFEANVGLTPSAPPLPELISGQELSELVSAMRAEASNGFEAQMRALRTMLFGKVINQGHATDILQHIDPSYRARALRELFERQMLIDSAEAGPRFADILGDAGAMGLTASEASAMQAHVQATTQQALQFLPPGHAPSAPPLDALPSAPPAAFSTPAPSAPPLITPSGEHVILLMHYDGKVVTVVGDRSSLTLNDVFNTGRQFLDVAPFCPGQNYALMVWPGRCVIADYTSPVAAMGIPSWARILWLEVPAPQQDERPADPRTAGLRFQHIRSTFFALSQSDNMTISRGELRNFFWNLNLDDPTFARLWERLDTRKRGFLDIDDLLHLIGRAHMQYPSVPIDALLYEAATLIIYSAPGGAVADPGTHFDTPVAAPPHGIGCSEACSRHGCSYFVSLILQIAVPVFIVLYLLQVFGLGTFGPDSNWAVIAAAVCYVIYLCHAFCCTHFASAVGNRISGMDAVCNILEAPKAEHPHYRWHIQCYHYETRTRTETYTDSNGQQKTRTVTETHRVNTHSSTRSGVIPSTDHTPQFVPNTTALVTEIDTDLSLDFNQSNYLQCYRHWCLANRWDLHADETRTEDLPSRKKAFLAEWVAGARPCWMRRSVYAFATLMLCSMWFRWAAQSRSGFQQYVYRKRCFQIEYYHPDRCHHGAAAMLGALSAGVTIAAALGTGGRVW